MIAYQPMNTDAPTVSKHGHTFSEAEERQQQYPFHLCPECMSEHTEVVKLLRSDTESVKSPTGFHRPFKRGVFKYECERVNYICKDCECEFYQWYRTGEKKSVDVDDDIAWAIIGIIMTALSLFMLFASVTLDDPPVWAIVVSCLSGILVAFFGAATCVALENIFE